MRLLATPCLLALATLPGLVAQGPRPAPETAARAFLDLVRAGKGAEAHARLSPEAAAAIPAATLDGLWRQLEAQAGAFQDLGLPRIQATGTHQVVVFPARFAQAPLDITVAFDASGRVAGFNLRPPAAAPLPPPPLPAGLLEREVTVGTAPWALPGTLLLPEGKGPFPAVVLVHGSGPQDRDETIGPNRPFRDLAQALGQRGIAVLRYDKRTRVHGGRLPKTLTLQEETVEDAALAVDLLRRTPGIQPARVFVLGHSLGGYALPRIAKAAPEAAGFIGLAGPSRPMEDLILEQVARQGAPPEALAQIRVQVARVKDPALKPDTPPDQLPLGIPAPYWLDLRGYTPAREALAIRRPFLFLQGGRDCQVLEADLQGWERVLKGRRDVGFQRFPELNHLFMPAAPGSKGEEYQQPATVDARVGTAIADWIWATVRQPAP